MIYTKKFISWFKNADEDTQKSMYNFVIWTFSSMSFFVRLQIAFELLMGRRFVLTISKNQKPNKKSRSTK